MNGLLVIFFKKLFGRMAHELNFTGMGNIWNLENFQFLTQIMQSAINVGLHRWNLYKI